MEDYYTHRNSAHRFLIQKIDDSGPIQLIDADGLVDEKFTKIMRVYPHGFASHSPKDAHMIGLGLGGRRDTIVAIGGEHEKYRPRKLAEGDTALYNHNGDVIRIFKKQMAVVHSEKITLVIGKGIENGGEGKQEDCHIVITKDDITLTKGSSTVKIEANKITHKSPEVVIDSEKVRLGSPDADDPVALCGGGCATRVFGI